MKRTVPAITGVVLICCFWLPTASADPKGDLVEKYYRYFQRSGKFDDSLKEKPKEKIPEYERDEIYACIMDRGAQDPEDGHAISNVLFWLGEGWSYVAWSTHLEKTVLNQTKHKDSVVRMLLVNALAARDKDKYRDLILSYLDDPNPEVQFRTVAAIEDWPDAKSILKDYMQKHAADPVSPANPVGLARRILGGEMTKRPARDCPY